MRSLDFRTHIDYGLFSMTDFEVAYDGFHDIGQAGNGIMCQPRSGDDRTYGPGGKVIEHTVDMIQRLQEDMLDYLRAVRFEGEEEDRRILLLVRYEAEMRGLSVAGLVAMVLRMAVPQTAAA